MGKNQLLVSQFKSTLDYLLSKNLTTLRDLSLLVTKLRLAVKQRLTDICYQPELGSQQIIGGIFGA